MSVPLTTRVDDIVSICSWADFTVELRKAVAVCGGARTGRVLGLQEAGVLPIRLGVRRVISGVSLILGGEGQIMLLELHVIGRRLRRHNMVVLLGGGASEPRG